MVFDVRGGGRRGDGRGDGRKDWCEVGALFLRLGCTAFGGPTAHIALMRREIVEQRGWLDPQEFLDLVGAVNLVPGPNSTELAIHIGYRRAGWKGFWAAGLGFILPAFVLVLALAALYARWGAMPLAQSALRGGEPVVLAIVAHALWQFLPSAIKGPVTALIACAALVAIYAGVSELHIIIATAIFGVLRSRCVKATPAPPMPAPPQPPELRNKAAMLFLAGAGTGAAQGLFWTFLKIGSVLYGSGYVLFSFLRAEFVTTRLITDRQLLDAIAIGQFTPGPLFTSATFVGYQIGGLVGAIAATVGIFAPAFVCVALLATMLEKIRKSPRARVFLDAVNAASFALMTATTIILGRGIWNNSAALVWPVVLFALSLLALARSKWNPVWLLGAGVVCGLLLGR